MTRKKIKELTKLQLIANAGGRCQFPGCNKKLFIDGITLKEFNNSNIAHIIAASQDGARGNEMSYEYSDKLENLMLMCLDHHKLIDDNPEEYTVEKLYEMKKQQEEKVQKLLDEMDYPGTEIVIFESPIKNKQDVRVDFGQTAEAVREQRKNPPKQCTPIRVEERYCDYKSEEYWKKIEKQLIYKINEQINTKYFYTHDLKLSLFPMAPIPLIIKLGNILGDKKIIDIYQKTRTPDTWAWLATEITNEFEIKKEIIGTGNRIALILSLTAEVDFDRITDVLNDVGIIYHLKAKRNGVDCIKSLEDLKKFWEKFQNICDQIKNVDKKNEVFVFPAIPVSAAFEVGRRHMPKTHPIMHIYDEDNGFFKTLTIGGLKSTNE